MPRLENVIPARIITPVEDCLVEVVNLSRSGAGIILRSTLKLQFGMPVRLLLLGAGAVPGTITWRHNDRCGLQLGSPIESPEICIDPVESGREYVVGLLKLQRHRPQVQNQPMPEPEPLDFAATLDAIQNDASELARAKLTRAAARRTFSDNLASTLRPQSVESAEPPLRSATEEPRPHRSVNDLLVDLEAQLPHARSAGSVQTLRRQFAKLAHPDILRGQPIAFVTRRLAVFNAQCDAALVRLGAGTTK